MFFEQLESLGDVFPLLASKVCARILVFDSPRGLPGSSLVTETVDDADLVSNSLVRSFALLEHLDLGIIHFIVAVFHSTLGEYKGNCFSAYTSA